MKKRTLVLLAAAMTLSLVACGKQAEQPVSEIVVENENIENDNGEDKEEPVVNVANPWTTTNKQGVLDAIGFSMDAPEGATDIEYSYMADGKMAQLVYVYEGADWVYRIQPADALKDISGMNYTWISETPGKVSGLEAQYLAYSEQAEDSEFIDDMYFVQVVNWYDDVAGVAYSLSASGCNLDGMDIQVYAENLYKPLQGDVDGGETQSRALPDDDVTIPFTSETEFHPEDYDDIASKGSFDENEVDQMMESVSDMLLACHSDNDTAEYEAAGGYSVSQEFYNDSYYGTRITHTVAWTGNELLDSVMKKAGYKEYEVNYSYPFGIWIPAEAYEVTPVYVSLYIDGNGYEYYFYDNELVRRNGPEGVSINPKTNDFINSIYKIGHYYGNVLVGERNRYNLTIFSYDSIKKDGDSYVLSGQLLDRNAEGSFVIDKDTVFDDRYETLGFEGIKDGETFYEWYSRAYDAVNNQENWLEPTALLGVWDVKTSGNHIDSVCGLYWWD